MSPPPNTYNTCFCCIFFASVILVLLQVCKTDVYLFFFNAINLSIKFQVLLVLNWRVVLGIVVFYTLMDGLIWWPIQQFMSILYWDSVFWHWFLAFGVWIPVIKKWAEPVVGNRSSLWLLIICLVLLMLPYVLGYLNSQLFALDIADFTKQYVNSLDPAMPADERIALVKLQWNQYFDQHKHLTLPQRL
jgi:hypothetical protein